MKKIEHTFSDEISISLKGMMSEPSDRKVAKPDFEKIAEKAVLKRMASLSLTKIFIGCR